MSIKKTYCNDIKSGLQQREILQWETYALRCNFRITLQFPNQAGRNLKLTDQITLEPNRDGIYAFEDENGQPFTQKDGLVFLTGVTGKFEGHGELIRIRTAGDTNHWVAEVKSGQHGNKIEAVAFMVALKF